MIFTKPGAALARPLSPLAGADACPDAPRHPTRPGADARLTTSCDSRSDREGCGSVVNASATPMPSGPASLAAAAPRRCGALTGRARGSAIPRPSARRCACRSFRSTRRSATSRSPRSRARSSRSTGAGAATRPRRRCCAVPPSSLHAYFDGARLRSTCRWRRRAPPTSSASGRRCARSRPAPRAATATSRAPAAAAPRAVGQAIGANPIPILIPCHRVVAAARAGRLFRRRRARHQALPAGPRGTRRGRAPPARPDRPARASRHRRPS